jgi:anaerobic magnesium-protoporphyrin IX monomethyl ester cyclase
MKIVLANIAHPAIGSRVPDDHLPPLGLLAVGGPLIDDGHDVALVDGDLMDLDVRELARRVLDLAPDAVLFGHSGSTSAQPIISEAARLIKAARPDAAIIYGGVHPTYHWREILAEDRWCDAVVRGEGERTTRDLIAHLGDPEALAQVAGIAFRRDGRPFATPPATAISRLDDYRVGWELIDPARYSYWGGKRAVVMQFSRGCPHLCTYCGQRGFWTRWRHRDPAAFAKEIAWLHREKGVELVNLADENPTSSRKAWKAFLEALIAENVRVLIVGSTRADDIVRDADILHLYKRAGVIRFLLGMENMDEETLKAIRKGGSTAKDREAIRLLRAHGIVSMATWVFGFQDETERDLLRGFRQLLAYDPDQIQAVYVTPHRWTPYYRLAEDRQIIQADRRRWDYKHQVLKMRRMAPWRLFLWFKLTELLMQARPRALRRILLHPDPDVRHAMRWYTRMGRRVWFREVRQFIFRDKRVRNGPSLASFSGAAQDAEEESMRIPARRITVDDGALMKS